MAKRLLLVLEEDLHRDFKALCRELSASMHQTIVDAVRWMVKNQAGVDPEDDAQENTPSPSEP